MKTLLRLFGATAALLALVATPAGADPVIAVGPYTVSSSAPFIVPIQVAGAIDLASFSFDLDYDATSFRIDTACDSFSDVYCDFATGPVTLGTFYTNRPTLFPSFLVPGVIELDATTGDQDGHLIGVNGIFSDPTTAPSGDGVLAYIEFVAIPGGSTTGPISVVGSPPNPTTVDEPFECALLAAGAIAFVVEQRRVARRRTA